uniref:Sulfhydryl oxidase n=1 Tax=Parastrongyloides trichosuri TaxID=131310 RepID=A0A0N4ZLU4_PARTI
MDRFQEIGPDGKPCKACVSTEELLKQGMKVLKSQKKSNKDEEIQRINNNCPVDKDELGRSTWKLLHTISVYYPDKPSDKNKEDVKKTIESLAEVYPCNHCAEDFRKDIKENPIKLESRNELANWMCEVHNRVNEKIGKDIFDCSKVYERWYDGWKDGSCS